MKNLSTDKDHLKLSWVGRPNSRMFFLFPIYWHYKIYDWGIIRVMCNAKGKDSWLSKLEVTKELFSRRNFSLGLGKLTGGVSQYTVIFSQGPKKYTFDGKKFIIGDFTWFDMYPDNNVEEIKKALDTYWV